jgi:hypothetical protein
VTFLILFVFIRTVKELLRTVSAANDMSGFVAHNLSGLLWSPLEVTNAMDRDATGDPEDAI